MGTRVPDAEYLATIAPLGVDINYVLHGANAYTSKYDADQHHVFLTAIEMAFGISQQAIEDIIEKSLGGETLDGYDPIIFFNEMLRLSSVFRLIVDRYASIDGDLLASILKAIDSIITGTGLTVTAAKKASAVVMLYRTFKTSGAIDMATIEDAIKLAAS